MEINLNAFSKRSMQIFQSALRFVTHMGHGFIGSEHFLWALAQDQGSAGRALRKNGLWTDLTAITVEEAKNSILKALGRGEK